MDRNNFLVVSVSIDLQSLSARRAWIEMPKQCYMEVIKLSLSARRAWIEIY